MSKAVFVSIFERQEQSTFCIQAVESSVVLRVSHDNREVFLERFPFMEHYFRWSIKGLMLQEKEEFAFYMNFQGYLSKIAISKTLKELLKIRSSQLNNFAFCINMHTKDALANGETQQRIFLLSTWREAPDLYTYHEKVALEVTEEITVIHQQGLPSEIYQKILQYFSEMRLPSLLWQ